MKKLKWYNQLVAAMLAAFLAVVAPFSIPFGAIPLTLATLGVYLAAVIGGAGFGTFAVALYLLLGAVGLPVFSGFVGGVQAFLAPTGGFLLGYLPCTVAIGVGLRLGNYTRLSCLLSLLTGTVVLYACGIFGFMYATNTPFWASVVACCVPSVIGDAVKMAAVIALFPTLTKLTKRT